MLKEQVVRTQCLVGGRRRVLTFPVFLLGDQAEVALFTETGKLV